MTYREDPAEYERQWYKRNRDRILKMRKEYYRRNHDIIRRKQKAYNKAYRKAHGPMRARLQVRAFNRKERANLLLAFGAICARCGFSDPRALQIDHVNGGGNKWRQKMAGSASQKRDYILSHRSEFQILCSNCNWIKRVERQEIGNPIKD